MTLKAKKTPPLPQLPKNPEDQDRFNRELLQVLQGQFYDIQSDIEDTSGGGVKGSVPIGGFIDFYQNPAGTLTIPDEFAEGNGTRVDDADSTWDGYRTPNVNGADVVLTVTWTADGGGAYATVPAVDVTALQQGDSVSGSGIDAGTTISDITGTTVTISDTDATGEIESTFTNLGRFARGGTTSGDGDSDRMQRIKGEIELYRLRFIDGAQTGVFADSNPSYARGGNGAANTNDSPLIDFDSANSTSPNPAKTSDTETAPIYFTAIKIMRIK